MAATPPSSAPITELLHAVQDGDRAAADMLSRLVYDELRVQAAGYLKHERPDHSLQPTALVNELFLRLSGGQPIAWQSRAHFFGVAAQFMRRILVDHARASQAAKRDGGQPITLDDVVIGDVRGSLEVVAVHEALEGLAAVDERQARLVELRFFVGLTIEETAEVMGISATTVSREWSLARAWLHRELSLG